MILPTKTLEISGIGLVIAFGLLAASNTSLAQTTQLKQTTTNAHAEAANFSGTWRLASSADQKNQRMRAIEDATSKLGRFKQGRAQQLMQKMTSPATELKIVDEGNQVKVSRGGFEFVVGIDQNPVTVKAPNGTATVRAERRDGRLIIESKMGDSTKTVTYKLSDDREHMQQEISISTSKLPKTVRYSTTYNR